MTGSLTSGHTHKSHSQVTLTHHTHRSHSHLQGHSQITLHPSRQFSQDSVRLLAVEAGITIAGLLSEADIEQLLLPMFRYMNMKILTFRCCWIHIACFSALKISMNHSWTNNWSSTTPEMQPLIRVGEYVSWSQISSTSFRRLLDQTLLKTTWSTTLLDF